MLIVFLAEGVNASSPQKKWCLGCLGLWHINPCRLFNAKSCLYIYIYIYIYIYMIEICGKLNKLNT